MILCICSHAVGEQARVQVCNVHTYISIHVRSLTLHIGVNDRGVLHGAGVPLKSTVKEYSCIDLYAEMVRGDDNVPSTLSSRQDKANARIVFLHYECMVKIEEKQLLANRTENSTEHKGKVAILKEHLDHVVKASLIFNICLCGTGGVYVHTQVQTCMC